jgi:hypothetical protein
VVGSPAETRCSQRGRGLPVTVQLFDWPELVRPIEVDDDHPLYASVADGQLVEWVKALGRTAS